MERAHWFFPLFGRRKLQIRSLSLGILISLLFFLSISVQTLASTTLQGLELKPDGVYLSVREKAIIALAFKAAETTPEEKALLVQAMAESVESFQFGVPRVVEVKSFQDFLNIEGDQEFFAQHDLEDLKVDELIQRMQSRRIFSKLPEVQSQIDDYYRRKREMRITLGAYLISENLDIFKSVENLEIRHLEEKAREKISALSADVMKNFGDSKKGYVALISRLLKSYFGALPTTRKLEILYKISQLPFPMQAEDVFLTMVRYAGPQFQKLLQLVGRKKGIPLQFRKVFQKLESQGARVPWWKVRKILEADGVLKEFSYVSHEPLGVGTMAQTHIAELRGQQILLRFLKPRMAELLQMDFEVLSKLAIEIDTDPEMKKFKLPSLSRLVGDAHASVKEELVIDQTIRNQLEAGRIYPLIRLMSFDRQKNYYDVRVPHTFKLKPDSQIMIQELVKGRKPTDEFFQYASLYPSLYKTVAEHIALQWVEQAFFKSGFFHADLHQGNLLAQVSDDSVHVYLLDYGMVGRLNRQLRESALLLAMGTRVHNPQLIAKHLLRLDKNKRSPEFEKALLQKVIERVRNLDRISSSEKTLERWTTWALDQGLDLNYEFLKLNRGVIAIHDLLEDAKSSETLESLAEKAALKNAAVVSKLLWNERDLKAMDYIKLGKSWRQPVVRSSIISCEDLFQ